MNANSKSGDNALDGEQSDPLPFLMDHLPEAFSRKAEMELNETLEKKFESLINLRKMIKGEKTLQNIDFHNDFLRQFLRHSKHDVQKAFSVLKNFVYNKKNSSLFAPMTDELFEKVKQSGIVKFLPKRSPEGCIVVITKYANWNPSEISLIELHRFVIMAMQECLRDQMTQINGMVAIHDWKDMSYGYFRHFTPGYLYKFENAIFRCFPFRYKSINSINHPAPIKFVWDIIRTILTEKMRKRFVFHSHPKDILEHIPATVIPEEYGGLLKEELYETTMSNWLTDAFKYQKQCPLGGQSNYY
ncbi:hypothetical protein JTE90_012844 [Oedothorax gibbosus]|uniref:CRAL-TRIO domain-containing protein n=1 Tax=Oedothorax gibbosus TaxID=931172 RepID=A0AAV6TRB8_9ARAC|nr:hypothetical protein JTE90_012844 [Oedothorax gibbosus]